MGSLAIPTHFNNPKKTGQINTHHKKASRSKPITKNPIKLVNFNCEVCLPPKYPPKKIRADKPKKTGHFTFLLHHFSHLVCRMLSLLHSSKHHWH
jgi:hypothetical protein